MRMRIGDYGRCVREYWRDLVASAAVLLVLIVSLPSSLGSNGLPAVFGSANKPATTDDPLDQAGREDVQDGEEPTDDQTPATATGSPADGNVSATLVAVAAAQWDDVGEPAERQDERDDEAEATAKSPGFSEKAGVLESPTKPVHELSDDQVAQAVTAYRQRIHEGDIEVELNLAGVDADRLGGVVRFFVLQKNGMRIRVSPDGRSTRLDASDWPEGVLLGDLKLRQSRWPDYLSAAAHRWLGAMNEATATLLLNPRSELVVYQMVTDQKPERGSRVWLRLENSEQGGVDIHLDRIEQRPVPMGDSPRWPRAGG